MCLLITDLNFGEEKWAFTSIFLWLYATNINQH